MRRAAAQRRAAAGRAMQPCPIPPGPPSRRPPYWSSTTTWTRPTRWPGSSGSASGTTVRVAYDGQSGVWMAAERPPDVVVCDIAMPKLSGLRVADALAQLTPKPLLIAVTAFAGEFPEAAAREAGFDFYLAKPADPFVVETLIRDRALRTNGH